MVSPTRLSAPRIGWIVALMLTAFFAVRLPILLFEPDWGTTEMDQFGLFASHLVNGLLGPPSDYLPQPHQGCTFLFGAWCAPIVAVGGADIGSLRLCSLTLHAAIAAVFTLLAGRMAGWKASIAAASLFVFAPPMLAHYAQKGSTNHDDCDLFVGLALLLLMAPGADGRSREALVRSAGAGALVGLAAAYMLDGGMRGAVVLGVTLLVWGSARLARATAMLFGLAVSVGGAVALGVSDGEDGVIRKAFSRSTLWADDQGGMEAPAPLAERIQQMIEFAFPTGFRVSGPDLWGLVPMSEGVLLYAYPVALSLLTALGIWAFWGTVLRGDRALDARGSLLVRIACVGIACVQCVAVIGAGLEVEVDYVVPIWPYMVLLACCSVAPSVTLRWKRTRMLVALLLLGGATLLCFEGMQWKLAAFYGGSSDAESDTWNQSRFAGSLRAARPERHAYGPRLVEREGVDGLRLLSRSRAEEAPAFLRMLGHATALQVSEQACGPESGVPVPALARDLPPEGRPIFWEGVGEQLVADPSPCNLLHGGPGALGWDGTLGAALVAGVDGDESQWDSLVRGVALGMLDRRDGRFNQLERAFPGPQNRRALCIAAGQWAFVTMRPVEVTEWLDPAALCSDEEFAVGWGRSVAREVTPQASRVPTPMYEWWWPHSSPDGRRAFQCSFDATRERMTALHASEPLYDVPERCLPELTPP